MHYYQFNIGDWVLVTSHLSLEEEAVYLRLINHYLNTEEPISTETQWVIRRLRLNTESVVNSVLSEFFELTDKGWSHKKCEEMLKAYRKTVKKNRENGRKGGRPRKGAGSRAPQDKPSGLPLATHSHPTGNPNQEPVTTNQQPVNQIKTLDQTDVDRLFGFFYSAYPKKVDKQKAVQKFGVIFRGKQPAQADELLDLIIINIEQRIAAGGWDLLNKQYIPSPAKYLLNKSWEDEIIGAPSEAHQRTSRQPGQIDPNDTSWGEEFLSQPADPGSGQQDLHPTTGHFPGLEAGHADGGKYRRS
jgi:uncharacterized protein YdaU (DUF1376 family)